MGRLKVLVVCLGNICRSPAGEAALKEAAVTAEVDLQVDSAGTGPWHVGERPHHQIRQAGQRFGLEVDGRGRQVTAAADLSPYDLVLAMDNSNYRDLVALAPEMENRIHLFASFDPDNADGTVADPYGYPDEAFDETIRVVRSAAAHIVSAIVEERIP